MNLDEFAEINGFPRYKINRNGDIWSRSYKKIMAPQTNEGGYLWVTLTDMDGKCRKRFIARLLALQYIENDNPNVKTQVNHKNHIRTDNRLENLEWIAQTGDDSNSRDKIKKAEGSLFLDKKSNGREYWRANYSFYSEGGLKGERINETCCNIEKSKCEEWLENIKKDPLQYRSEKIEMKAAKIKEEVALTMEKMVKKIEKQNKIPLTSAEYKRLYHITNRAKILERVHNYAITHKEEIREKNKLRYDANKKEINAKRREEYNPETSYYAQNREKIRADYDANKDERNRKRREDRAAKKLKAEELK
jgi:hypothetical protein